MRRHLEVIALALALGPAAALACRSPNGVCEAEAGESCRTCVEDCGPCPVVCGDHYCDPGETPQSCRADCANPAWPIAVEDCALPDPCVDQCSGSDFVLPGDGACFTSLSEKRGHLRDVLAYFPSSCCVGNTCGGGEIPPHVVAGDPTNAVSGRSPRPFELWAACPSLRFLRVAIIPCGTCGQPTEVVGFALVGIQTIDAKGRDRGLRGFACCDNF